MSNGLYVSKSNLMAEKKIEFCMKPFTIEPNMISSNEEKKIINSNKMTVSAQDRTGDLLRVRQT